MNSHEIPARIAVDANPLFSALLNGRGATARTLDLMADYGVIMVTTAFTIGEVLHYLPRLSRLTGIDEAELELSLSLVEVEVWLKPAYAHLITKAEALIRDPKDAELLALAMHLDCPVWTHDKDFNGIPGLLRLETRQLLRRLTTPPESAIITPS